MKIVIIGAGKIGITLAEQLVSEDNEVTVIDKRPEALEELNALDVMTVEGNGISKEIQLEAGIDEADLAIAVLSTDEENLLACLIAKKLGVGNTIARVRNPEYSSGIKLIKGELGLSMALNPELASASEIARILRAPSAIKIDAFSRGRVELYKVRVPENSPIAGRKLIELGKVQVGVLICVVERGEEVFIPSGNFTLLGGDRISFISKPKIASKFFQKMGISADPVRQVMLLGGGKISYYLAKQMLDFGAAVKIIESNMDTCEFLAEHLPDATIIRGDATNEHLLAQEGLSKMDAVASLTGIDEENVLMSLYARSITKAKIVTKINRTTFSHIIESMDLGSVFHPRNIAADHIVRFVRALKNSMGSNVETLYKIVGNKAEALEFRATAKSAVCGKPLMELKLLPNLLIGAINRGGKILTPSGKDTIEPGDSVIVVTTVAGLNDLDDILAERRIKV
ncbi:MAG: Trk system potassium transporter TrkA [Oscillospiraceae bacterium]|nr:Trk system potassium transporter TrkA [Oscillospiraceae bacterium]